MAQEPADPIATVSVETSPESARTPPPWLGEAVLVLQAARDGGLLGQINEGVRVPRGRMGLFEVCDFVLMLVVYTVSGEATLLSLYRVMAPFAALLSALWSRDRVPARCTLSRFLCAMRKEAVEALREILFVDLCEKGLRGPQVGGLWDRRGQQHVVLDADGTRQAARQRQVVSDAEHPPVRRRLSPLCAPGYLGRKRGEAVRTRTTVQQAHTREWLGTFGAAGNGDAFGDLARASRLCARYLLARGLRPAQGVLRTDGQFGYVRGVQTIVRHGLGYLMRCADYRLLALPRVKEVLAGPPQDTFGQADTGTVREVFDIGFLDWTGKKGSSARVTSRLLVTRRPLAPGQRPSVGVRVGEFALELFVTDRDEAGFSAKDLLGLYFARGGFEQTLSEEDREQDPDRWCSHNPAGQEAWQLLCQWVWNLRLRLGAAAKDLPVRRTLFAEAEPAPLPAPEAPASPAPPVPGPEVAPDKGRGAGKFAGAAFRLRKDGALCCPAGKTLRPQERAQVGSRLRVRYAARAADCACCPLAPDCRGAHASTGSGRRVSVFFPAPPPSSSSPRSASPRIPLGPAPLLWVDLPATSLRNLCRRLVYAQKVLIPAPPPLSSAPPPLTRAQRAHRRLDWRSRLAKNAHPRRQAPWRVQLFGVPVGIAAYLDGLRCAPS